MVHFLASVTRFFFFSFSNILSCYMIKPMTYVFFLFLPSWYETAIVSFLSQLGYSVSQRQRK